MVALVTVKLPLLEQEVHHLGRGCFRLGDRWASNQEDRWNKEPSALLCRAGSPLCGVWGARRSPDMTAAATAGGDCGAGCEACPWVATPHIWQGSHVWVLGVCTPLLRLQRIKIESRRKSRVSCPLRSSLRPPDSCGLWRGCVRSSQCQFRNR